MTVKFFEIVSFEIVVFPHKFYPTSVSSYTRSIYKIVKICLSPTADLTKHFTPHIFILTPAVITDFENFVSERERERKKKRV